MWWFAQQECSNAQNAKLQYLLWANGRLKFDWCGLGESEWSGNWVIKDQVPHRQMWSEVNLVRCEKCNSFFQMFLWFVVCTYQRPYALPQKNQSHCITKHNLVSHSATVSLVFMKTWSVCVGQSVSWAQKVELQSRRAWQRGYFINTCFHLTKFFFILCFLSSVKANQASFGACSFAFWSVAEHSGAERWEGGLCWTERTDFSSSNLNYILLLNQLLALQNSTSSLTFGPLCLKWCFLQGAASLQCYLLLELRLILADKIQPSVQVLSVNPVLPWHCTDRASTLTNKGMNMIWAHRLTESSRQHNIRMDPWGSVCVNVPRPTRVSVHFEFVFSHLHPSLILPASPLIQSPSCSILSCLIALSFGKFRTAAIA